MSFSLWLLFLGLLASNGKVVDFDRSAVGKSPPGWSVNGPAARWEIRKDASARTQPYVLAHIPESSSGQPSSPAILDGLTLQDGEVSVRFKPVKGRQAGGVVWRYRDQDNYYVAQADAQAKTIAVFKVENGRRVPLTGGIRHEVISNNWCILKVWARGARFQVYMDHRRIAQGADGAFSGPGKVGLWTGADSLTYFDDFRVYPR
jgi:hypothetical protein